MRILALVHTREEQHEDRFAGLVGGSSVMRRVFRVIDRVAPSDATVLIEGETGVGKELVAEAIHQMSHRARRPFQVLDCRAIAGGVMEDQLFGHEADAFTGTRIGVFEAARGGTLFLDEIGELPLEIQAKLVRCLETRQIRRIGANDAIACDVRIIAATNRDLAHEVNQGTFRADLYYRLAVARLAIPPLRARHDDIPLLIEHFTGELDPTGTRRVSSDFIACAMLQDWPGNVRELRNAVERNLLVPDAFLEQRWGSVPALDDADPAIPFKVAKQAVVDDFERKYLISLLEKHGYNISDASRAAGIDRITIHRMMRRLGINAGVARQAAAVGLEPL